MNKSQNPYKSNQEIIDEITKIVEPYYKFEMDDFYGDRGGIPYPKIEELSVLWFKFQGKLHKQLPSKSDEDIIISKIKELDYISSVEIVKIQAFGRYVQITLNRNYTHLITRYNNYLDFKNANAEKINWVYEYLEEKIPEEFVGWELFIKSNKKK